MKHLLTGAAVVAALAISAPGWAQQTNPSGGNSMGMPGPSPGGPGLTPYSTGAPPPSAAAPGRMPAGGRATSTGSGLGASTPPASMSGQSMSDTSSATPPRHRQARKSSHGKMAGHHAARRGKGPQLTGSTANQLNQEELQRLQAGNFSSPSAPAYMPPPSGGPPGGGMSSPPSGPRTSGASGAGPR